MTQPFSGKNYGENSRHIKTGETPCAICGKGIKENNPNVIWIIVIDGGSSWGTYDSDENAPGYMGGFPIGSDCWKKHKAELGKFIGRS